ncbi:MAG: ABC transporter ATP-binding protein [Rhizobiaceae bacterium]|nr:MAG: ABC transporter ATP-binding protein [Rhizobiaceae bacterium]CAG0960933.1 sulfate transport system ATP-binding protein [Rhizobiaceae bacterium]
MLAVPRTSIDSGPDVHGAAKLRVKALEKHYGSVVALRPTSLNVMQGEFLTLLGPSGSGKTTLLMMIAGLAIPDGGEIWIDGKDSTYAAPYERDVGVVFQNYALFPHLTVYENVAFPLRMRKYAAADIRKKVMRMLDVVGLPHVADRLPRELSGGQQQRVALARCAVYGPSIILMDEPLGALDKKLRDTMQFEIKRMHREIGSTTLYVTHDQGEAMSMSDRICLMNNGGIEQLGRPEDLYFSPRSRFAADFLGGTNFIPCQILGSEGDRLRLKGPLDVVFSARPPLEGALSAGSRADIVVRPQHIRITKVGETPTGSLPAEIVDRVVTGATTEYRARLADGTVLVVMELTDKTNLRVEPGQNVMLGWHLDNGTLLPTEDKR